MVAIVCLLIGFSGPSIDFELPGPKGWVYIGVVVLVACAGLVRLLGPDAKRRRLNKSGINNHRRGSNRTRKS
jgi:hypothetical protein